MEERRASDRIGRECGSRLLPIPFGRVSSGTGAGGAYAGTVSAADGLVGPAAAVPESARWRRHPAAATIAGLAAVPPAPVGPYPRLRLRRRRFFARFLL